MNVRIDLDLKKLMELIHINVKNVKTINVFFVEMIIQNAINVTMVLDSNIKKESNHVQNAMSNIVKNVIIIQSAPNVSMVIILNK